MVLTISLFLTYFGEGCCKTLGEVFRLGVNFILSLSQEEEEEQEEQEQEEEEQEEPSPKSIRGGCTRRLIFYA